MSGCPAGSGVNTMLKSLCWLAATVALTGAHAQPQTEWSKRVENGDTLIGISKRFLREPLRGVICSGTTRCATPT
jgi:hypothetical protein